MPALLKELEDLSKADQHLVLQFVRRLRQTRAPGVYATGKKRRSAKSKKPR